MWHASVVVMGDVRAVIGRRWSGGATNVLGMAHTHDGIDWTERLVAMRRADAVDAEFDRRVAERLVGVLSAGGVAPVVAEIGAGAGGMSVQLAPALAARGGGRVVLADAVDELLAAAVEVTRGVAGDSVQVDGVRVDAADDGLPGVLPAADLVWAS